MLSNRIRFTHGVFGGTTERQRRALRRAIHREHLAGHHPTTLWRIRTAAEIEAGILEEAS